MASKSNIEWTGHTWNPIAGCTVLTPGCKRCYAMKMAARLEAMGQKLYAGLTEPSKAGPVWTGVVRQAPEHTLMAPLKRKKPTTYFVNSMSDLHHDDVPDAWIDEVVATMAATPQHTYQILTKRAARMRDYWDRLPDRLMSFDCTSRLDLLSPKDLPLKNVWLGVSAERQQEADERIPHLLETPAAVRFVSAEPLLGPIDFTYLFFGRSNMAGGEGLRRLHWIIVGGESGRPAREFRLEWGESIVLQCRAADVACFVKQIGSHPTSTNVGWCYPIKDRKGGDPAEWPPELRVREMPGVRKAEAA